MLPFDPNSARDVFTLAGFEGEALDIALGVAFAESQGFEDAVGDVALVDDKWGASIGLFQIRSLRNPLAFSVNDRYRYNWALRSRFYNAQAAYAISNSGTNWNPWSVFRSGAYELYQGQDFEIRTGHVRASQWNV